MAQPRADGAQGKKDARPRGSGWESNRRCAPGEPRGGRGRVSLQSKGRAGRQGTGPGADSARACTASWGRCYVYTGGSRPLPRRTLTLITRTYPALSRMQCKSRAAVRVAGPAPRSVPHPGVPRGRAALAPPPRGLRARAGAAPPSPLLPRAVQPGRGDKAARPQQVPDRVRGPGLRARGSMRSLPSMMPVSGAPSVRVARPRGPGPRPSPRRGPPPGSAPPSGPLGEFRAGERGVGSPELVLVSCEVSGAVRSASTLVSGRREFPAGSGFSPRDQVRVGLGRDRGSVRNRGPGRTCAARTGPAPRG